MAVVRPGSGRIVDNPSPTQKRGMAGVCGHPTAIPISLSGLNIVVDASVFNPFSASATRETSISNPSSRTRSVIDELHKIGIEPKCVIGIIIH